MRKFWSRVKLSNFQRYFLTCVDELYFEENRPEFDVHGCLHSIQRNAELAEWVKNFKSKTRNTFMIKHHVFVNFTDFGVDQPTYINVARDPINLFASKFYFLRYSCNGCTSTTRNHPHEIESLKKCVDEKESECTGEHVHQGTSLTKSLLFNLGS